MKIYIAGKITGDKGYVWRDIEINLYGTSQPSIVDACAALYVAYRIACWVTEEVTDQ